MTATSTLFIALGLATLVGCGDDQPAASASRGSIADAVAAFRAAGLEPGELTSIDGRELGSTDCKTGTVSGVETMLCAYSTEAAAKAAQPGGLARIGEATGSALTAGKLLLVVADRAGHDKDGKIINRLTKAFLQKPAPKDEQKK